MKFGAMALTILILWSGCNESSIPDDVAHNTLAGTMVATGGLRIAHLTDPHVYDGKSKNIVPERANEGCLNLRLIERTILEVNAHHHVQPIDVVIVTGDIGIEQLIESAGIDCKRTVITSTNDGHVLFDGTSKDTQIHANFVKGAADFAKIIAKSTISDWLFVNGNNDLCNEDVKSIRYFNDYMAELTKEVTRQNPAIRVHNLVAEDDHVSTFSPSPTSNHVFIGFENGSWKNNHAAEYADGKNKMFQYGVLRDLEAEVEKQERLGKQIHLVYHCPHFDDPWNASSAPRPCEKRFPTNARFEQNCSITAPKIPTNQPSNLYSAWLVRDDFRSRFNAIAGRASVKNLIAGHFHSQNRQHYMDPSSYQTQTYSNLEKYNVAPPISIKNQTVESNVPQARGFSLLNLKADGSREANFFWSNQVNNSQCSDVQFSPWVRDPK